MLQRVTKNSCCTARTLSVTSATYARHWPLQTALTRESDNYSDLQAQYMARTFRAELAKEFHEETSRMAKWVSCVCILFYKNLPELTLPACALTYKVLQVPRTYLKDDIKHALRLFNTQCPPLYLGPYWGLFVRKQTVRAQPNLFVKPFHSSGGNTRQSFQTRIALDDSRLHAEINSLLG